MRQGYISKVKYYNRNHKDYWFEKLTDSRYRFVMKCANCGGKKAGTNNNISMFEYEGGPTIQLGMEVDHKTIVRIRKEAAGFLVEVKL